MPLNRKILSVSQLNREARFILEKNFSTLWVEGEISNLSRPASGHIYFTLKDQDAQIRCAMFRNRLNHLRFNPQNGEQIALRGSISLYEARGDYQLIAEHMEEAGEGALQRAYEQLKKRLEAEGLFDESHKQPIPSPPKRLGLISSPRGAAIHDILSVLKRRFPALPVTLYPTVVQGADAPAKIIAAIAQARTREECDLIILSRGGGSMEDLWCFNDEAVAQAIYHCNIPILSAIGHETDFTIADFVSDLRAPTPSAAAELISPDQSEWIHSLQQLQQRLLRHQKREIETFSLQLHALQKRLRHPGERMQQVSQRLDEMEQRLQRAQQVLIDKKSEKLRQLQKQLQHNTPDSQINQLRGHLYTQTQQLKLAIQHQLHHRSTQLSGLAHTLDALSPLLTLARGYSITLNERSEALLDIKTVRCGDTLETRLHKGHIVSQVVSTRSR